MTFAKCDGPIWPYDDLTRCFQHDFLQTLIPLLTIAASLLFVISQAIAAKRASASDHAYKSLPQSNGEIHDGDPSEDSLSDDEQDLTLHPTRSKVPPSTYTLDKPKGALVIPVIEEVVVVSNLVIQIAALATHAWGSHGNTAAVAGVVVWLYIAALTTLRLVFATSRPVMCGTIWYHTSSLYWLQWICAFLLFRSQIIHPQSDLAKGLMAGHFVAISVLSVIALCSRRGNSDVEIEVEGGMEPSKELTASVISLITYSWMDSLIYKGYKRTLEVADVWDLATEDKAAEVIAQYRQVKKTASLAFHLLSYFKTALLWQSLYAVASGFNTFVPTVLLKVILEYVEDPSHNSRNTAWLYVILLLVSGFFAGWVDGMGLWLGRKICIQLRAIVIGEVYAKALRRRAAASADKPLGGQGRQEKKTEGDEAKPGLLNKISQIFKKKKKDAKPDSTSAPAKPAEESEDEGQASSGAIINLMAVDSFKVAEVSSYLHFLWGTTPVQLAIAVFLLYTILGYSSIAGIVMMIILMPINYVISKQFASSQKKILAATDARIHVTNEVLTNIRIIKYFAWEQRFLAQVDEKRAVEIRHLRNRYILWTLAGMVWAGAPLMISFLTFLIYTVVEKRPLVPSVAFSAMSLFSILRVPLDQLADMIARVQEFKVSVDRVEEYLNEPETGKYEQLKPDQYDEDGESKIALEKATLSWGSSVSDDFKLIDMDISFKVGTLNVIVGPTGSGKTSVLMALLGEMTIVDGAVYLPGARSREEVRADPETGLTDTVAYCAQQPWLVNGTIEENIVFASAVDKKRYNDVIVACSLQRDLEILDKGDQTLVGEKGITLSGGQKQRISLARALYCRAKHVLLDDVLSAVDAHTAKWIFDNAIMGPLMLNRTCILVTHNATLCVPKADFVVALDNGRIASQGTANHVIDSGKLHEDLTKSRNVSAVPSRVPSRVPSDVGGDNMALAENSVPEQNGTAPVATNEYQNGADLVKVTENIEAPGIGPEIPTTSTVAGETRATGGVKPQMIIMYLASMGSVLYWTIAILSFVLQQVAQVATNVWIREWSNEYREKVVTKDFSALAVDTPNTTMITKLEDLFGTSSTCFRSGSCLWPAAATISNCPESYMSTSSAEILSNGVDDGYFLGVYALICIVFLLIAVLRNGWLFYGSIRASRRIHTRLIGTVMRAKFRFFDSTPLGQIMNRFSKDIEMVDQEIAPIAEGIVHCLASIITIITLISIIVPQFLIAAFFISILYVLIGLFYINTSRDLKRLESVQRSPLYQQFGETLSGMTTIRAYGDEKRFLRENMAKINTHSRPFIFLWGANRWLAFRIDIAGSLISFSTGVFVILSTGRVDAGAAGLAMTYAVSFTENVLWLVRLYSMNEQNMNSVERIKEYFDVEQEAPAFVEDNRPPANWPSKGGVELIGYSTRYRKDFDYVLKNITVKIKPGEKVGVVGRTGAGKSSLALALFRALEAEEGKILVDDVDIGLIGLQDLRENIVMVPQDPTLFSGTIRNNLDPFGLYTDEEIFEALRRVQLIGAPDTSVAPSRPETPKPGSSKTSPEGSPSQDKFANGETTPDSDATTAVIENKNIFKNLSSAVAESGSNLSQGQRQLLCLARALLKAPMVLLMDEATASIDYATDSKIQETLREFRNTTLTIAHRLQTIIDYDKVLVLDKGEVIEFGDPHDLIRKSEGSFRAMCETSGDYDVLLEEARKASLRRKLVDDE